MSKNHQSPKTTHTVTASKKPKAKTMPRMMEQERAAFALSKVSAFTHEPVSLQKELRSHVSALPALIRMNGLGQALAFYRMKGENTSHERLYRLVSDWLCREEHAGCIFEGANDVLNGIASGDMFQYMAAQNETLALLEWVKKFANALLKTE